MAIKVIDNGNGTLGIYGCPVIDNHDGTIYIGPPANVKDNHDGTLGIKRDTSPMDISVSIAPNLWSTDIIASEWMPQLQTDPWQVKYIESRWRSVLQPSQWSGSLS